MEKSMPTKQEVDLSLQERFTDALFCLLADKALDRETRSFMGEEAEPPTESEIRAFAKLLDRSYTRYCRRKFITTTGRILSKASMFIVAAFLVVSVAVVNVSAIREPLLDWVFRYYADHTEITFPDVEETIKLPKDVSFGYLPEGFTEIDVKNTSQGKEYMVYSESTQEKYIRFSICQLVGNMNIDTEDTTVRYKNIGDGQIVMITEKDYIDGNRVINIVWYDENLIYVLFSNAVSEEELFMIMESIKVK